MENASKALLIAGEVLIGILILSLGIVLYNMFKELSEESQKKIDANKLNRFNSQFYVYEGRDDLNIYDIIEIAAIAHENNISYDYEPNIVPEENKKGFYVQVNVKFEQGKWPKNIEWSINNEIIEKWITDYFTNNSYKYKCNEIGYSNLTGRINYIKIEQSS